MTLCFSQDIGGLRAERGGIRQNYLSTMERGKLEVWGGDSASDQSSVCEEC